MVKLIKRISDNKYLLSPENDTWVDSVSEALTMTYQECEDVKSVLLNLYSIENLKEIVDFSRRKPVSDAEIKQLRNLLKNK